MNSLDPILVRMELEKIVASPLLARSGQRVRLLRYLIESELAGRIGMLKESVIGVEVFGRPAGWDTQADSIVRVQSARLRERLREYYATEGQNDPIVIEIPKGGYTPQWRAVAPQRQPQPRLPTWVAVVAG